MAQQRETGGSWLKDAITLPIRLGETALTSIKDGFGNTEIAEITNAEIIRKQRDAENLAKGLLHKGNLGRRESINTFTGCDISVFANTGKNIKKFAEMQTMSYSIHREKYPVRTLGRTNPKGFSRGPRTISGTLIFTVFDRSALWELTTRYPEDAPTIGTFPLVDQLPPFDVTITFQNEYADMSALRILGVEIVDEGQVHSIDDLILENTMQYVARDMIPMAKIGEEVNDIQLGMYFPNTGLFTANSEQDVIAKLLQYYAKKIGETEAAMAAAGADLGLFNSLSAERLRYIKLYESVLQNGIVDVDSKIDSILGNPRLGGYSSLWGN